MILKKRIRDGIILAGVFIMAVLVFSYLTNKGDDSMTADLRISDISTDFI